MIRYSSRLGRRPLWKRILIAGLGVELLCFIGAFGVFARMNIDRDLRLYVHNKFPRILDGYYKIHEMSNNKLRDKDFYIWKTEGKVL